jgi:hypothetical protein
MTLQRVFDGRTLGSDRTSADKDDQFSCLLANSVPGLESLSYVFSPLTYVCEMESVISCGISPSLLVHDLRLNLVSIQYPHILRTTTTTHTIPSCNTKAAQGSRLFIPEIQASQPLVPFRHTPVGFFYI